VNGKYTSFIFNSYFINYELIYIRFGRAFTYDSGNTVGEIMGHSKTINSCHIRANRPYRAITAGDDNIVCFFHGPPYRFQFSIKDHKRFVNCVRFSPNGDHFASVGADGKVNQHHNHN
jgi:WD40 repeat protein